MDRTDTAFDALQGRLGHALDLSQPGRDDEHVMVALPSFSLGESLLSHYGDRIPALEHRYLLAMLVLNRIACDLVLVVVPGARRPRCSTTTSRSSAEERRASARARLHVLEVPDPSHRSIAEKLLDRPDLIDELRRADRRTAGVHRAVERHRPRGGGGAGAGRADQRLGAAAVAARASRAPVAGCSRRPGVPVAAGCEDVRTIDDVLAAVAAVRAARPARRRGGDQARRQRRGRRQPGDRPAHPRRPARHGSRRCPSGTSTTWPTARVVEELITGTRFTTPSVQIDVLPDQPGRGARHPRAGDGRRRRPGVHGLPLPRRPGLRRRSWPGTAGRSASAWPRTACSAGRASTSRRRGTRAARWHLHALEVNLRKGGTTHPYAVLRNIAPGPLRRGGGPVDLRRRVHPRLLGHRQPRRPGVEGRAARPRDRPGRRGRPPARPRHRAPASCCTCCRAWPSTAASASPPSADHAGARRRALRSRRRHHRRGRRRAER